MRDRVLAEELMDRPDADATELRRSLRDLERINLLLGGRGTVVRLVLDFARRLRRSPLRVLDVASGGADIPLAIARRARDARLDVRITATDLHPTTLAYARERCADEPWIEVRPADALELPFPDGSFDLVTTSTSLHHFDRDEAARVLSEMDRVARDGLIVTDLERSYPAMVGARLLAATLWRDHPITKHDGPASVRAAFTVPELRGLAEGAVEGPFRVRRHPLFRLSLVVDRSGGRGG